jgi:hypothetical protein
MNKVFGIVGAILFAASVAVGYFCNFPGSTLVGLGLAAFALASMIVGIVRKAKAEGSFNWKTVLIIVLAVVGGALCAIGGYSENIFEAIAGAVIAIISVIFGIFVVKKQPDKEA